MGYIFISYSHKDQDYAHELYKHLFEHGLDAWVDDRLDYGSRWPDEIERRVHECSAFVLVMSSNSRKSDWVQNELLLARKLNKPIYTLLLEGGNWWHLETIQYFDVRNEELPSTMFFVSLANVVSQSGSSPNISINVAGVVTGNIVVGNDNNVQSTIDAELEIAREKAIKEAKEKADREAERAVREKLEFETAEKIRLEKVEREKAQQKEAADAANIAREKLERETAEKARLENVRREKEEREAKKKIVQQTTPVSRKVAPTLFIVGSIILFFLICGGIGVNYLINNSSKNSPVATSSISTEIPEPPTSTNIPFTPTPRPEPKNTPVPALTLGIGSTMIGEKGETLVYVPAGEFTMGDGADDAPVHTVYLDAFWIDQTEVTNKQYKACVDAGICDPPALVSSKTHPNYYGNPKFDNYPVVKVTWRKANGYCEVWAGGDLPTEAQWEKAARGTDARTYPWGNDAPSSTLLNYNSKVGDTTMIKNYPNTDSFYGTYDMAGNVLEWVNDWYSETYYEDSASSNNPLGPVSGQYRVLRGGSWSYFDFVIRSADRAKELPTLSDYSYGFRCASPP